MQDGGRFSLVTEEISGALYRITLGIKDLLPADSGVIRVELFSGPVSALSITQLNVKGLFILLWMKIKNYHLF